MLKIIKAENYKSFQKLDVSLTPITLFVGPNNSGKSSAISIIRLLSQTNESNDPNVRLLLNGALGDFGTYKDLIHGNQTKKHLKISFSLTPDDRSQHMGSDKNIIDFSLTYKYRPSLKEVILKSLTISGDGKHHITAEFNEDSERFNLKKVGSTAIDSTQTLTSISRGFDVRNFIPRALYGASEYSLNDGISKTAARELRTATRNAFVATSHLRSIEYVGAMRMPPSRTYLYTGERRKKVGANGEHAITLLAMDSIRRGSKSKGIRQKVVKWLTTAQIASDIKIIPLSDRYFEVQVQHPITKEYQNFADVGYGNSQVIPVLVAGYNCSSGDTLIAEEPEIHLHPKAQAELGDFLVELHEHKVQTIIETHSEHMIVRLQQHVASGRLRPEAISVFYVNPTPNGKALEKLELNDKGIFTTQWPGGFFPERLEEARQLAILRSKGSTNQEQKQKQIEKQR